MTVHLKSADRIEITVLVDNYIDIFVPPSTSIDHRLPFDPSRELLAEHGLSCLIRIFRGAEKRSILLDAGLSQRCMIRNADVLGISLSDIEAVVLSHGHFDHTGGLCEFFSKYGGNVPLILHPDALVRRRLNNPVRGPVDLPQVDKAVLTKSGAKICLSSEPSFLVDDYVLVTGEVERTVSFETGMPGMEMYVNETWISDPILDDQALVFHVKDKGLIILSGCAHAGIINTIQYSQKITGSSHVHAVLGGFHLTGPAFESRIMPTVDAIKEIDPDFIVPMHCTGWDAINSFSENIPGKCILNTVGTTYVF